MSDVVDNQAAGRFELDLGDDETAIAEYRLEGRRIVFPHTVVPEGHEGQGIGTRLIKGALASARKRDLTVVPQCSFFASYMKRHPETHDLLDPADAEALGQ